MFAQAALYLRNYCGATVSIGLDEANWRVRGGFGTNTYRRDAVLRGPSALLKLQSDERLIAMTRRGQHAAFETLCARYNTRLLSFCRHMLASKEDAEDVLQEVFAAASTRCSPMTADQRAAWLYRIARNRSLNHLRRATSIGVDSMDIHFAENGLSRATR